MAGDALSRAMAIRLPRRLRWAVASVIVSLLVGWAVGEVARDRALRALDHAARVDAPLRAALLESEITRFRLLPLALADDRDVAGAMRDAAGARDALNRKLEGLAQATGAAVIYAIRADGRAIAASNWRTPQSFVGSDYTFRRYFLDAARSGTGAQFALGTVSHRPGLYLARRTAAGGVIVVKLEFDRIENAWARAGGITYVTDADGVVLVSSRPAWRFAATRPVGDAVRRALQLDVAPGHPPLAPLPVVAEGREAGIAGEPAARFVAVAMAPDRSGWRLHLLLPTRPTVADTVRLAQIGAALATLALLGAAWVWREQHRRRADRVASAAQRTAELERAVAERTVDLRREIEERAASEARAAELREGLRQANRLATLGQVTASVAHETAQPVAAIRTYARTSEMLLDRGDAVAVRENLAAISRLADRIGAVTAELRGFARKGAGELRAVALAEVIEGAALILREQLRRLDVTMPVVPADLMVFGGKVRLEQVLVNLMQNAAEALAGHPAPTVTLALAIEAQQVRLTVADNGPGVAPEVAARIFTPFVTSRATGLGLGLVIAQDIMLDMGGSLRLLPSTGGARFEIAMRRA